MKREFTQPRNALVVLAVVALTALAGGLYLYDLDGKSLWGDEMNMYWFSTGERDLAKSSGNALGYLPILQAVSAVSTSDFALRLPAALLAIPTIPLLFLFGRKVFDRRIALTACLLFALAPLQVAHAQQVHSYTLFGLLALGSLYLLWRAYDEASWKLALAFTVVHGLGMWVHLYMVFVLCTELAVLVLWLALDGRLAASLRSVRKPLPLLGLAACYLLLTAALIRDWIWPLGRQVVSKFFGVEPEHFYFKAEPKFELTPDLFWQALRELFIWRTPFAEVHYGLTALAVVGVVFALRRARRTALSLLLFVFLPLLPIALFSLKSNIDFGTRRLLFLLPVVLLFVAAGIIALASLAARAWRRVRPKQDLTTPLTAVLALVVAVVLSATALRYYYERLENGDLKAAVYVLEQQARPGDLIVAWRPEHYRHYYQGDLTIHDMMRRPQLLQRAATSPRLWYLRPRAVKFWDCCQPNEEWLSNQGALQAKVGGGLFVSFLNLQSLSDDQRQQEYVEIMESLVEYKGHRAYARRQLAREYRRAGQKREAKQQLRRSRELAFEHPFR